uniref:Uncharacterized protein n=1 Tax=Geospiza parvula TaxID=87175 RepID=A0A8C3Q9P7_GEOPR
MGCFTFIKVMMILFNLAIFLSGGTLLGVGIWVKVDGESFLKIFGMLSSSILQVVNVAYLLIVIGAILLVIGFLGCYGAQKESKCLLMMFFSVMLIIFIAEVAAAVVALVFTGLVSATPEPWVGLMWDVFCPLGKQEPWAGSAAHGRGCSEWSVLQEEGTLGCCSLLAPATWAGWSGLRVVGAGFLLYHNPHVFRTSFAHFFLSSHSVPNQLRPDTSPPLRVGATGGGSSYCLMLSKLTP